MREHNEIATRMVETLEEQGIVLTPDEAETIEVTDFGLNQFPEVGLQLFTYVNTTRYCAKELMLLPHQTCPEHRHPHVNGEKGKKETFRCRFGSVHLFVEGEAQTVSNVSPPANGHEFYTAAKEVILKPGEQYTIEPNTLHWFKAGELGAIITEFSSTSNDSSDVFTDSRVVR